MNIFTFDFGDGFVGKVARDSGHWHVEHASAHSQSMTTRDTFEAGLTAMIEFREKHLAMIHGFAVFDKDREINDLKARIAQFADPELVKMQDRLDSLKYDAHIRSIGCDDYYGSGRAQTDASDISALQNQVIVKRQSKGLAA